MKDTFQILCIICTTFFIAFITSLLLDINWISSHWSRVVLVIVLMTLELFVGAYMLFEKSKGLKNNSR